MSAAIASWAARLTSAGAGKSGKPWDRFTAPCSMACRVISRITDSVKRATLVLRKDFGRVAVSFIKRQRSTMDGSTAAAVQARLPILERRRWRLGQWDDS